MYHVIIADKNDKILYGEIFIIIADIDFLETGFEDFIIMQNSVLAEMLLDDKDIIKNTFYKDGRDKIEALYQITRDGLDSKTDYSLLYDGKPLILNIGKRFKRLPILSADTGDGYTVAIHHC